jgi:hypothetical protein
MDIGFRVNRAALAKDLLCGRDGVGIADAEPGVARRDTGLACSIVQSDLCSGKLGHTRNTPQ